MYKKNLRDTFLVCDPEIARYPEVLDRTQLPGTATSNTVILMNSETIIVTIFIIEVSAYFRIPAVIGEVFHTVLIEALKLTRAGNENPQLIPTYAGRASVWRADEIYTHDRNLLERDLSNIRENNDPISLFCKVQQDDEKLLFIVANSESLF